jgi:hypothetical protein
MLQRNISPPSSAVKTVGCFMLVFWLDYSSTLKMAGMCSSDMSFNFHRTTWHYIPEEKSLLNYCSESLKSYKLKIGLKGWQLYNNLKYVDILVQ